MPFLPNNTTGQFGRTSYPFTETASYAASASVAFTASVAAFALTASYAQTASLANHILSASYAETASIVNWPLVSPDGTISIGSNVGNQTFLDSSGNIATQTLTIAANAINLNQDGSAQFCNGAMSFNSDGSAQFGAQNFVVNPVGGFAIYQSGTGNELFEVNDNPAGLWTFNTSTGATQFASTNFSIDASGITTISDGTYNTILAPGQLELDNPNAPLSVGLVANPDASFGDAMITLNTTDGSVSFANTVYVLNSDGTFNFSVMHFDGGALEYSTGVFFDYGIFDSISAGGFLSIDPANRQLVDIDGSTVIFDWSNGDAAFYGGSVTISPDGTLNAQTLIAASDVTGTNVTANGGNLSGLNAKINSYVGNSQLGVLGNGAYAAAEFISPNPISAGLTVGPTAGTLNILLYPDGHAFFTGSVIANSFSGSVTIPYNNPSTNFTAKVGFNRYSGSSSATGSLPSPSTATQQVIIKNAATFTLLVSGSIVPSNSTSTVTSITMNSGSSATFYSDGVRWDQI